MSEYYIYGFVRKDLDPVYRIVQFGHACISMMGICAPANADAVTANICLIGVEDEKELVRVAKLLEKEVSSVPFVLFYETDHNTGYTALCTVPVKGMMREAFSGWNPLVE